MRFSYLPVVLISAVLLDSAGVASSLGGSKAVSFNAQHAHKKVKLALRLHATEGFGQDERMARVYPFKNAPVGDVSDGPGILRYVINVLRRWPGRPPRDGYDSVVDNLADIKGLMRRINSYHDDRFTGLWDDVSRYRSSMLSATPLTDSDLSLELNEMATIRAILTIELSQRFVATKDMAKRVEWQLFRKFDDHDLTKDLLVELIPPLRRNGYNVGVHYIQNFADKFEEWQRVHHPRV